MTEGEWGVCIDPRPMLRFLRTKGSKRLWRLFAVACVRPVAHLLRDARSRKTLEVAERFADGHATAEELLAARAEAQAAADQAHYDAYIDEARADFRWDAAYEAAWRAAEVADAALQCVADGVGEGDGDQMTMVAEALQQPDLIREVFGNPFRWTLVDPSWLAANGGAAGKLAKAIYDCRAFERLPLLADALKDAGCADADLLAHLRAPGLHVRGCWALDLVLGKT